MTLHVAAPGKLILLGEYAVLGGVPALVAAVQRFARCTVESAPAVEVHAPGLTDTVLRTGETAPDGTDPWRYAREVLRRCEHAAPGRYTLDTSELSDVDGKLGLGSSAASTAVFVGGLAAAAGRPIVPEAVYREAVEVHSHVQGSGSGADVAASAHGGVFGYTIDGARTPVAWPASRPIRAVWSGQPASTPALVAAVRSVPGDTGVPLLLRIGAASRAGIDAVQAHDFAAVTARARETAAALEELGAHAGVALVTDVHRRLDSIARAHGAVCKPTGAGGGDLAWVVGPDEDAEQRAVTDMLAAGYRTYEFQIAPAGAAVV